MPIKDILIRKVRNTIRRYSMIQPGDRVVVAVSGGPDSVCLLDVMCRLREEMAMDPVVAHFDHGLRPDRSNAETQLVAALARSRGLGFASQEAEQGLTQGKGSLEEKARNARYAFLDRVCDQYAAQKIALGHQMNDQAETVLMNILRGSGPAGMAGIPPRRGERIIRPLIEVSRAKILDYLKENELEYAADLSNADTRFLRNRIRLELLPHLENYQPKIVQLLGNSAEIMRGEEDWLEQNAEEWLRCTATRREGEIRVPLGPLRKLADGSRRRAIRAALKTISGGHLRRINFRHIEAVNGLVFGSKPQASLDLPRDLTVKRVYDDLIVRKAVPEPLPDYYYVLPGPGTFFLKTLDRAVTLQEGDRNLAACWTESAWTVYLDCKMLDYPLAIRNFKPGDKFVPLGMRGRKKIKDFFIDLKIPAEKRRCIPILEYKGNPVWVCGYRLDERYKITAATRRVLKVSFG